MQSLPFVYIELNHICSLKERGFIHFTIGSYVEPLSCDSRHLGFSIHIKYAIFVRYHLMTYVRNVSQAMEDIWNF